MYAIYGNMDPINIPPMLAYIPAPWILWDNPLNHGIILVWTNQNILSVDDFSDVMAMSVMSWKQKSHFQVWLCVFHPIMNVSIIDQPKFHPQSFMILHQANVYSSKMHDPSIKHHPTHDVSVFFVQSCSLKIVSDVFFAEDLYPGFSTEVLESAQRVQSGAKGLAWGPRIGP